MRRCPVLVGLLVLSALPARAAGISEKKTAREALQPFNTLIGSWRGTGEPNGTREEKQRGFWEEKIAWQWHIKGKDAWLVAAFDRGKHLRSAELRYLPASDRYQLTVRTAANDRRVFQGALAKKKLTLEREDREHKETQRLVVTMLHGNRFLYRYEVRRPGQTTFKPVYLVGATKEGADFASVDDGPECVVSGGLGTMPITYKGKTYYVCCSGCRDAFKDDPERFIKEYEARQKKKAKK